MMFGQSMEQDANNIIHMQHRQGQAGQKRLTMTSPKIREGVAQEAYVLNWNHDTARYNQIGPYQSSSDDYDEPEYL